jgi:hypothetical protein
MDPLAFTRQLSAWVDPFFLLEATLSTPESLEETSTQWFPAKNFISASQVGLDHLVQTFLTHFALSEDLLTALPAPPNLPFRFPSSVVWAARVDSPARTYPTRTYMNHLAIARPVGARSGGARVASSIQCIRRTPPLPYRASFFRSLILLRLQFGLSRQHGVLSYRPEIWNLRSE